MAKLSIKPDSASVSLLLFIQDSASTVGAGKTGLAYNTASLTCYYVRPGSAAAAVSLVTQTVTGAWSSGGFVEIDATNMPGVYRFDVPNAVLAAGVRSAVVMLKGASGMAPLVLEIDLGAEVADPAGVTTLLARIIGTLATGTHNPQGGDAYARLTGTVEPAIADMPTNSELATALASADDATLAAIAALNNLSSAQAQSAAAAALTAYDPPTNAEMEARTLPAASYFDPAVDAVAHVTLVDTVTTLTNMPAAAPTAADNADAVWDELLAGHAGAGSAGLALSTASSGGVDPSVLADAVWDEALSGHSTAGTTGKKLTDLVNADLSGVATQASVNDLPTVAEFEARTLPAADYTVVSDLPSVPSTSDIKTALEADGGKLDHLWEMTEDDGGVRRLTTNALEQAPAGGAGTSDLDELIADHDTEDTLGNVINDLVEEIGGLYRLTAGALAMAPGGGATTYSYSNTVDNGSGSPLDGVFIELATDSGMTNVVNTTHTNALGAFTVYSDIAGTHYLRLQLAGYSFAIETVTLA